ncbi:MAG: ATP-binding cassette domain-containing protein [Clostridiales bacterium]|nr:ATP-binding cassette domain-containing protein [Clostridiales bacterium]MCI7573193.1 ATP-binding cassette domain-containing protein [Clostridiales bacterium]
MAHFHIENLTFSYPGSVTPTLDGVSLDIEKGEFLLLCGRSGSGKTTLLRQLKPTLTPYGKRQGEVFFDGKPIGEMTSREQAEKIGFVMQDPQEQIVTDKVWHELAFGLENLGCDPAVMRLRVAEMASFFGIQDWFHREVAELSGGQKQLLNLASVMAMQPEVLILDEPTSQLDPISAGDFLNTLKKINRELGTTIVITEHRMEDIFPAADRVAVMEDGRLTFLGSPREVGLALRESASPLFSALPAPVRVYYAVNPAGRCPLTVREGRAWLSEEFPEGASVDALPEPACPDTDGEAALVIKECWLRYTRTGPDVLRGLNLRVPRGSLFAILGGNGTGKSTALKAVCGSVKAYRGSIEILGKRQRDYRPGELFRGCLSMLPQDPRSLFVKETVLEDLQEMGAEQAAVEETAALCRITELLSANPADLSGGELQRAALAKVLLRKPKLLLLDEPTKGMDSIFKAEFAAILDRLCREGVTVVMVSHDVEFCAEYAQLVGLFFDGQLITTGTPQTLFGSNSFYTTAVSRMSRHVFRNAVTSEQAAALIKRNREAAL